MPSLMKVIIASLSQSRYLLRDTQGSYPPQYNNNMLGGRRIPEMMLVEPDSVKKDGGSLEMPGVQNKKQIKLGSQRLLEGLVEDNLVRELSEVKLDIARRPPWTDCETFGSANGNIILDQNKEKGPR